ncbi:MAG: hypothetical protein LUC43_06690 [Burkholderiales bacterium]|nr:hypothetical protein [Burkholderiales bacterium]
MEKRCISRKHALTRIDIGTLVLAFLIYSYIMAKNVPYELPYQLFSGLLLMGGGLFLFIKGTNNAINAKLAALSNLHSKTNK